MIFYTNPVLTAFQGILQTRGSIRTRARFWQLAMHGHYLATGITAIMRLSLPSVGAESLAEREYLLISQVT
jgi:hypothetical protein